MSMDLQWVEGFTISTSIDGKAAVIRANREEDQISSC